MAETILLKGQAAIVKTLEQDPKRYRDTYRKNRKGNSHCKDRSDNRCE